MCEEEKQANKIYSARKNRVQKQKN